MTEGAYVTYTHDEARIMDVDDPPRGWLWRTVSDRTEPPSGWVRWTFTTSLDGRTYPPGTRFAPVYERPPDRDRTLLTLAAIMQGLAVPNSIAGPRALGTASEPWETLYHQAFGIGYPTEEEWFDWLRRNL